MRHRLLRSGCALGRRRRLKTPSLFDEATRRSDDNVDRHMAHRMDNACRTLASEASCLWQSMRSGICVVSARAAANISVFWQPISRALIRAAITQDFTSQSRENTRSCGSLLSVVSRSSDFKSYLDKSR